MAEQHERMPTPVLTRAEGRLRDTGLRQCTDMASPAAESGAPRELHLVQGWQRAS
jgi:hypothetical protein